MEAVNAPSPDALDPADLPVRFGRYELQSLLGEGGMGRVFLARLDGPEGFRKTLALKVVRHHVAEQRGVRDAIVSEARLGGLLSHPHLVDIYDFGIEGGQPWIAMELVRGESLAERLQRGAMPARELLDLLIALTRALVHLHDLAVEGVAAGLVHRDLKPGNVLLGRDGQVKLTDFGLARAMEGPEVATWSDAVRGTPAYMAPEQARGVPLDGRSDLFALGAIAFEAATGERLLRGATLIELMSSLMRIEDRLEDLPSVDRTLPGLGEVLLHCLREDPAQRYPDAASLLRALLGLRDVAAAGVANHTTARYAPMGGGSTVSRLSAMATPIVDLDGVFVGRGPERALAAKHYGNGARLVTIVGAGGTGKTRLARRVGAEMERSFPGGVLFADLTTATTEDGVCHAVATALSMSLDPSDPSGSLAHALRARGRCLLLMDNFEQVAVHAARTLTRWLTESGDLAVLATSRTLLRVAGEQVLRLGPLPVRSKALLLDDGGIDLAAAAAIPAVELFVARAAEANPTFALREENAGAVLALVAALEGIPLAIELAAARTRVLSPQRILERLPRRFDLLTTGRSDATARHATLRSTIDWSWQLLEPWEQAALAQLSVFRGGFTLESAEDTLDLEPWPQAPWVMDVVQALADKSLLRVVEPPSLPTETRFAPYETIREYAAEMLEGKGSGKDGVRTGSEAVAEAEIRHGRHYGQRMPAPTVSSAYGRWRRSQFLELDNLLAAANRAAERGDDGVLSGAGTRAMELMALAGPYATALDSARRWEAASSDPGQRIKFAISGNYANMRQGGSMESLERFATLLPEAEELGDTPILIDVLIGYARQLRGNRDPELAMQISQRAVDLARETGDQARLGDALSCYGTLRATRGEPVLARAALEHARQLLRSTAAYEGEVRCLVNLSLVYKDLGLDMLLEGTLQEAIRRGREIGHDRAVYTALLNLGVRWQETGRLAEALDIYKEALAGAQRQGDRLEVPIFLANIADVQRELGLLHEADSKMFEAVQVARVDAGTRMLAGVLTMHADVLIDLGRLDDAEAAVKESIALSDEAGARRYNLDGLRRLATLALKRDQLELADDLLAQARDRMGPDYRTNGGARVYASSGELARRTGELAQARSYLTTALEHARACDDRIFQGMIAVCSAAVERDAGALDEARRLLSTASHVGMELGLPPNSELMRSVTEVRITV